MRVRWTQAAAEDLDEIHEYLKQHLPRFAQSTIREIYQSVQSLKANPYRGRSGRVEGTRELVLPRLPYLVAYRVREAEIEILHVAHGARKRE